MWAMWDERWAFEMGHRDGDAWDDAWDAARHPV